MPWSNQSGGGGGKAAAAVRGARALGRPGQQPDLEELLKRSQDKLKQVMPGGSGCPARSCSWSPWCWRRSSPFFAFTFRVNPDELGVVMRFGKPIRRSRRACISACPIRSRRCACRR